VGGRLGRGGDAVLDGDGPGPAGLSAGADPVAVVLREDPVPIRLREPTVPLPLAELIDEVLAERTPVSAEEFSGSLLRAG
jgi:hypothetical protein